MSGIVFEACHQQIARKCMTLVTDDGVAFQETRKITAYVRI